MECKLELNKLTTEDRSVSVLYATHDFIVYQDKNKLVLSSCDGTELSSVVIPVDFLNCECLDLEDALLFVFSGTEILVLDKNGLTPIKHTINPTTLGRCASKIYRFPGSDNQIVFGTQQVNRIQFVNYDFMEQVRVAQTSSWNVSKVTNTLFVDTILYAVLDKSIVVATDMSTGEVLWTKFETAEIAPGLVVYDKYLLYACHGMIKKTDGQNTIPVRIPLINVSSILHANEREIYVTASESKNIVCYDLVSDKIKWEIFGKDYIHESVMVKSNDGNDVLIVRTEKYITLIDLSTGKSEYNIKTNNIARIRNTGDHLIIQKTTGHSTLVPGVPINEFD